MFFSLTAEERAERLANGIREAKTLEEKAAAVEAARAFQAERQAIRAQIAQGDEDERRLLEVLRRPSVQEALRAILIGQPSRLF